MFTTRQILTAFMVAAGLTEPSLQSGEGLALGKDVDRRAVEDIPENRDQDESRRSTEPSGEAHGDMPADDNSLANELGFDLGERAIPPLARAHTPPNRRGRRNKRFKSLSRALQQRPPLEFPVNVSYPHHYGAPTTFAGRHFDNTQWKKRVWASGRTAVMVLLVALVVAWAAKQISAYKRAKGNLSVLRSDRQMLLSQVEMSRVTFQQSETHQSEPVDAHITRPHEARPPEPLAGDRVAEAEEDSWNAELVAELVATRNRLAELQQEVEDIRNSSSTEDESWPEETSGAKQAVPLTHEEALQEKVRLEEELACLKKQRRELDAIVKLREEIEVDETFVKKNAAVAMSTGHTMVDPKPLYRKLIAIQQAYTQLDDSEKVAQVAKLKGKLKETLDSAKKACSWAPGVAELNLLLEKDKLQEELISIREKIAIHGQPAALSKMSKITSFASRCLYGSAQLAWKAANMFNGGRGNQETDIAGDRAQGELERARAQRERERLLEDKTLENLKNELADARPLLITEQQLLSRIHSYDSEQFTDWLARKNAQARAAAESVIATLRRLPPEVRATSTAQREYSAALESSRSKAVAALEHVER